MEATKNTGSESFILFAFVLKKLLRIELFGISRQKIIGDLTKRRTLERLSHKQCHDLLYKPLISYSGDDQSATQGSEVVFRGNRLSCVIAQSASYVSYVHGSTCTHHCSQCWLSWLSNPHCLFLISDYGIHDPFQPTPAILSAHRLRVNKEEHL